MGACVSSSPESRPNSSNSAANVVTVNGELRRYAVPVTALQVLMQQETTTTTTTSGFSFFLCSSDSLFYDDYIPALDGQDQLQAGQIYFLLPNSKLQYPLAASDMAALAVKASVALRHTSSSKKGSVTTITNTSHRQRKSKMARVSPVVLVDEQLNQQRVQVNSDMSFRKSFSDKNKQAAGLGVSRSVGSVGKLQRYSSKGAKTAVRSFKRLGLTTIYEGAVLQLY
ncbi:hypothetical protein RJ639_002882 [Escallonia herrerae]|uniref:Uncharacterized protein n=1 Tax=Escallonia herrerae TaxID=1293975 RepID=A0AA88W1L1_9ASTE|nr:hypothetical protein RJ639_002882 [Escallonia herrerae]